MTKREKKTMILAGRLLLLTSAVWCACWCFGVEFRLRHLLGALAVSCALYVARIFFAFDTFERIEREGRGHA